MNISNKKIAVIHDAFLYRWGGERLVTLLAKSLDADLISGFFSEWSFNPRTLGFTGNIIALGNPVYKKWFRHLVLKSRFKRATTLLSDYDIVILSGNCLDILQHYNPSNSSTKIVYYCHTPPRYLFDFRENYIQKFPTLFRSSINSFFDSQAHTYKKLLSKIDLIFTNSENVYRRLQHFCGYDSTILYPPADADFFVPKFFKDYSEFLPKNFPFWKGEYFFSWARLSPPKRVSMIIAAFLENPQYNLVCTYGKNDPEKDTILKQIAWKKNIFALESPDDDTLLALIQNAKASMYIPVDEDFWMTPVESMLVGTPVIWVNDWGLKETIIPKVTGILLPKDITPKDIAWALQEIDIYRFDASLIRKQGMKFSLQEFCENTKKHLERL